MESPIQLIPWAKQEFDITHIGLIQLTLMLVSSWQNVVPNVDPILGKSCDVLKLQFRFSNHWLFGTRHRALSNQVCVGLHCIKWIVLITRTFSETASSHRERVRACSVLNAYECHICLSPLDLTSNWAQDERWFEFAINGTCSSYADLNAIYQVLAS